MLPSSAPALRLAESHPTPELRRVPAPRPGTPRAWSSQRALVIASLLYCDREDPPTHRRRP